MDHHTQLWNQYQHLTDEIKTADAQNFQILGVLITAIVAILNAGFANSDPVVRFWMFLSGYAVTFPARRLFTANQVRVWRIATYMRVFLEPGFDCIRWQTRLHNRHQLKSIKELHGLLSSRLVGNELRIFATLNALMAVALISGSLVGASNAVARFLHNSTAVQIHPLVFWWMGFACTVLFTGRYFFTTLRFEREIHRHGPLEEIPFRVWSALKDHELVSGTAG